MRDLQALVDAADDAALLVAVDGLCASRRWDDLSDLARRCREAVEMGKQLWAVATHIDYRLCWEGPPAHAAAALRPGAGRFALGPLTEVAASTHTWAELAPHLADPVIAAAVAQERTVRGEDLRQPCAGLTAELPFALAAWEPAYALPRYSDRSAAFPAPPAARQPRGPVKSLRAADAVHDDDARRALADIVRAWTDQSSGICEAVAVEGSAEHAIGCMSEHAVLERLTPDEALSVMQWAGASGGAKGQRRGGAAGRFSALWSAAALLGMTWPEDAEAWADLGKGLRELDWFRWGREGPDQGWVLRLAVADPVDGLAWAVEGLDAADDQAEPAE